MVSKVVWLVLDFPLPTGPLLSLISCVSEMPFLEMDKVLPLFICQQGKKNTSRISVLLAVEFGSALKEFKQRGSRIKLENLFSLDMFYIPHEILFCMMCIEQRIQWCFYNISLTQYSAFTSCRQWIWSHRNQRFCWCRFRIEILYLPLLRKANHCCSYLTYWGWSLYWVWNENRWASSKVYISNASKKPTASSIYKSKNGFKSNLKGAFLAHTNDIPVFQSPNAVKQLKLLRDRGWKSFLLHLLQNDQVLLRRSSQST